MDLYINRRKPSCEQCGESEDILAHYSTRFCRTCSTHRPDAFGATAARNAVKAAVLRGDLPPAKTLVCADCGKPARDYDHRDNAKPLEVEPVCRSCNKKRGPARPALTFELPDVVVG